MQTIAQILIISLSLFGLAAITIGAFLVHISIGCITLGTSSLAVSFWIDNNTRTQDS